MRNGKIVLYTQSLGKTDGEGFGGIKEVLISGRQSFSSNFIKIVMHGRCYWKKQAIGQLPRYIIELITFQL